MPVFRLTDSVAARLALGNGVLLVTLILVTAGVFYFGTVGVLARSTDGKIVSISNRLRNQYGNRPPADLVREIKQELTDGIDSDTEIFLVTAPSGRPVVGNLSTWPPAGTPMGRLINRELIRDGRPSFARLYVQPLPSGGLLYVGRDLSEQLAIRMLVLHALEAAMAVSLGLVVIGAWLSRHQIERRISGIRQTARAIESGNLEQRIAVSGDDEFARLGVDINRMLDRIEQLMNGVRHVSNAIAHDLRTPLGRVRARLDEALRREPTAPALSGAARAAIEDIDELIVLLNKLLQIAEAESGMRAQSFERVDLNRVVHDMVELYDAAAEEAGVTLAVSSHDPLWARGDHDLLATAVASLIDNALKYAGRGASVEVAAHCEGQRAVIVVRDTGPGVPESELARLTERFYRMDRARTQPGNGLGLAIVAAIATLHGGKLQLSNADPGLRAAILLPQPQAARATAATAGAHLSNP
ncbi:MAG TPA: HAMP domain-containing sensor histidine kinase [Steroidobacteraceae bacterium]|jgi:signal transduction histidine kinase|nr:HAMP domain-containing sensor histidine kinase [Steroidobacteraceae bacterium]